MGIVVGGNSYCTLAEAEIYIADEIETTNWDAATDELKGKWLILAARKIEKQNFKGTKYVETQVMELPRNFTEFGGASGVVNDDIKKSQSLEALSISNISRNDTALANGVKSRSVKSGSVTYLDKAIKNAMESKSKLSSDSRYLLKSFVSTFIRRR